MLSRDHEGKPSWVMCMALQCQMEFRRSAMKFEMTFVTKFASMLSRRMWTTMQSYSGKKSLRRKSLT